MNHPEVTREELVPGMEITKNGWGYTGFDGFYRVLPDWSKHDYANDSAWVPLERCTDGMICHTSSLGKFKVRNLITKSEV